MFSIAGRFLAGAQLTGRSARHEVAKTYNPPRISVARKLRWTNEFKFLLPSADLRRRAKKNLLTWTYQEASTLKKPL